jgi:hypothetical protein
MEPVEAKIVREIKRQITLEKEFMVLLGVEDLALGKVLGLESAVKIIEELPNAD